MRDNFGVLAVTDKKKKVSKITKVKNLEEKRKWYFMFF